ncbi:MAG: M28 family peptidase [Tepidisphaeraceae bacterium]
MLNIFRGIHTGPLPPLSPRQAYLAQRLRQHVEMLAGVIGERNCLTHPHNLDVAAQYVERVFNDAAYLTQSQPYTALSRHKVRNIDAELPGTSKRDEIVLVGAHYDSIHIPGGGEGGCVGANDNASGVAAMLEIARTLRLDSFARTVRFVAFVNEEPPFFQTDDMGSLVYARRCRERGENIVAMITPETIGCYSDESGSQTYPLPLKLIFPNVGNFIAFVGNGASSQLVGKVTELFRRSIAFPAIGFAAPGWVSQAGWSDHWSFWKCGYPALMATDTAPLRYRHYHTPQDTPDKIDYDRMARVVDGLTQVVDSLATEERPK